MAEECEEKGGYESGFPKDAMTITMQNILYEDCILVRQHKQLLEDEEYAKSLQDTFDAEVNPETASLSVAENDDEDISQYYELDSRTSPFKPRRDYTSCTSSSTSSFSSSWGEHATMDDSDDDLPAGATYEDHSIDDSNQDEDEEELSVFEWASSDVLNLLPIRIYSFSNVLEITSDNKSCLICLLDWETGDCIKSLPCFHDFHSECIDKWLMIKESCPVCRYKITQEDP